jgi:hypothetical protein
LKKGFGRKNPSQNFSIGIIKKLLKGGWIGWRIGDVVVKKWSNAEKYLDIQFLVSIQHFKIELEKFDEKEKDMVKKEKHLSVCLSLNFLSLSLSHPFF